MVSSKNDNKKLYIDKEALSALAMVQEGLLYPLKGLMGKEEALMVDKERQIDGVPFPFSFVLAPSGAKNKKVLERLKSRDEVKLICEGQEVGELVVDETFPIDTQKRLQQIYGTSDVMHPGVQRSTKRLGEIALSGAYKVEYAPMHQMSRLINETKVHTGAQNISVMMMAANPLNRAHERIIRGAVTHCDLLVIFLRKPFTEDELSYQIRYETLQHFVENFLPKNRAVIVPFETSYIFAGFNELMLDAIIAKNIGAEKLIVGKNHGGMDLVYNDNRLKALFESYKDIGVEIVLVDEYVYCDICKTLVSVNACPHGQHHHIHYHSKSILSLIKSGIIPPPILVRKEISAKIFSKLFAGRFENFQQIRYSLMPGVGLLEDESEEEFYLKLIELYQTTSLT